MAESSSAVRSKLLCSPVVALSVDIVTDRIRALLARVSSYKTRTLRTIRSHVEILCVRPKARHGEMRRAHGGGASRLRDERNVRGNVCQSLINTSICLVVSSEWPGRESSAFVLSDASSVRRALHLGDEWFVDDSTDAGLDGHRTLGHAAQGRPSPNEDETNRVMDGERFELTGTLSSETTLPTTTSSMTLSKTLSGLSTSTSTTSTVVIDEPIVDRGEAFVTRDGATCRGLRRGDEPSETCSSL